MSHPLNKEQKAAVTYDKGPLLVSAGPGSGKTRVIAERVKFLIEKKKLKQKSSPTVAAVKKQNSQSKVKPTATVEKLKIRAKGSQVSVSYNLTNQSNKLQRGRTGMYLSSKTNLEKEIKRCDDGRADYIHLDVMDGKFVPNTTFDHIKIKELRPFTIIPFDTHLMINEPVKHVRDYVDAGSDIITVHTEVCNESSFGEIHDILKSNQISIGLAINPDTELPDWSRKFIP